MQQNSFSYPAMLDLKNKKCVIIGGGKVAVRKALPLIEAGADLTVIAPAAVDFSKDRTAAAGTARLCRQRSH
jgi:siroheme synthase (precorrin-2 oxidase/ferrochelatase)